MFSTAIAALRFLLHVFLTLMQEDGLTQIHYCFFILAIKKQDTFLQRTKILKQKKLFNILKQQIPSMRNCHFMHRVNRSLLKSTSSAISMVWEKTTRTFVICGDQLFKTCTKHKEEVILIFFSNSLLMLRLMP